MDHLPDSCFHDLKPDPDDPATPTAAPPLSGPEWVRGRPFLKGQSGNPAGRPVGSRNQATLLAEALLDDEGGGLTRKAVAVGMNGNPYMLRAWLDRLLPARRERLLQFELPPIESPADLARAMGAVMAAVAAGEITPGEAERISNTALAWMRAIENTDLAVQLQELRERDERRG
jgi:hypothetical protein